MAKCQRVRVNKRKICIGDLTKAITLEARAIQAPGQNSVDYTEQFNPIINTKAAVKTVRGETIFDGSNTERVVTHKFWIRFRSNITFETWIEMDNIKFDVLDVENLDERNEWLAIRASKRGIDTLAANFA